MAKYEDIAVKADRASQAPRTSGLEFNSGAKQLSLTFDISGLEEKRHE